MAEDEFEVVVEKAYECLLDFAKCEVDVLARRTIHRLQRIPATDIHGDDYRYKTLWDEYCHEVQSGPTPFLEEAMDSSVSGFVESVVDKVPDHVARLLTIYAASELDQDDLSLPGSIWLEGIAQVVESRLSEMAGERDLERFEIW